MITIQVNFKHTDGTEEPGMLTLPAAGSIPIRTVSGRGRTERTFRETIVALSGTSKRVMIDIYVHLVAANYINFNEQSGKEAARAARLELGTYNTFPNWDQSSTRINAPGQVAYNILKHSSRPSLELKVATSLLEALLATGVWSTPTLDMGYSVTRKAHETQKRENKVTARSNLAEDLVARIGDSSVIKLPLKKGEDSSAQAAVGENTERGIRNSAVQLPQRSLNTAASQIVQDEPVAKAKLNMLEVIQELERTRVDDISDILLLEQKYRDAEPQIISQVSQRIERGAIAEKFKRVSSYKCLVCKALGQNPFAFRKKNGEYYIEVHHVIPVSRKQTGSLGTANLMTLCPNHHRQIHYGNVRLLEITDEQFVFAIDELQVTIPKLKLPRNP